MNPGLSQQLKEPRYRCGIIAWFLFGNGDSYVNRGIGYEALLAAKVFPEFYPLRQGENWLSHEMMVSQFGFSHPIEIPSGNALALDDFRFIVQLETDYRNQQSTASQLQQLAADLHRIKPAEFRKRMGALAPVVRPPTKLHGPDIYAARKKISAGLLTGVKSIDDAFLGIEYGTVSTILGWPSHGKSVLFKNTIYLGQTLGYSAVVAPLEVPKELFYVQMLSRHSFSPKFQSVGQPVDYKLAQKGLLSPEQEKFLFDVVEPDYLDLPGKIHIIEHGDVDGFDPVTLRSLFHSLPFKVDVFGLDYIQLAALGTERDSWNALVNGLGQLSRTDVDERYIVIIVAQANRKGYEAAVEAGGVYSMLALSDINQLERESYYIMSMYLDDTLRASGEVKVQTLKHKGGEIIPEPVVCAMDPRYSALGENIEGYSEPVTTAEAGDIFSQGLSF